MPKTPDGYDMCPQCGHHISAYCGSCTAFVREGPGEVAYCRCDCRVALGGKSLHDMVAGWMKEQVSDSE